MESGPARARAQTLQSRLVIRGTPMSKPLTDLVRELLALVQDPHTGTDLVASGAIKGVAAEGSRVSVDVVLGYPALSWHATLRDEIEKLLEAQPGIDKAVANVTSKVAAHKVQKELTPLPN